MSPPDVALTADQARHLSTWLALLSRQLQVIPVADLPAEAVRAIDEALFVIEDLSREFGLESGPEPTPLRHVEALAATWLARLGDLEAASLRAYGPPLADGDADRLDRRLGALGSALSALRETTS